jgi:glutamyl-tRNA reductase
VSNLVPLHFPGKVMTLFVLGINHTTAPLALREKVAFAPEKTAAALQNACDHAGVDEAVILSTCNRTELYLATQDARQGDGEKVLQWLADYHSLPVGELADCHYFHNDLDAMRHMMRVASGLDSMILGEPQILGQLKSAYVVAQQHGKVSGQLHSAFQYVFATAKRVRSETAIGENPVSVAYAAVTLSRRIFADLSQSKALLIGAGKNMELVARHLKEQGIQHLVIANRTLPRAQELLALVGGGEAILLADIPQRLHEADIVISSTASQLPILGKGAVEQALKRRKRRPIFMVDIAVPRDIEPQVAELEDVYLYTVDDLKEVIDENKRTREEAAQEADKIIDEAIEDYLKEVRAEEAVSTIKGYRHKAEQLRDEEVQKALRLLRKGDDAERVLQALARNITNKLLHHPTVQLKKAGSEGRTDLIDFIQQMFDLDREGSKAVDDTEKQK